MKSIIVLFFAILLTSQVFASEYIVRKCSIVEDGSVEPFPSRDMNIGDAGQRAHVLMVSSQQICQALNADLVEVKDDSGYFERQFKCKKCEYITLDHTTR